MTVGPTGKPLEYKPLPDPGPISGNTRVDKRKLFTFLDLLRKLVIEGDTVLAENTLHVHPSIHELTDDEVKCWQSILETEADDGSEETT